LWVLRPVERKDDLKEMPEVDPLADLLVGMTVALTAYSMVVEKAY
jgi:hypothetical protein